ncbi:MAG: ABC transporter permease subunit [Planctomycetota bacterium]
MRSVLTLTLREIRQTFLSPIAYAFLVVFVLFTTFMFFRVFWLAETISMAGFFGLLPLAFAIVIPGITMRTWAEERKQGTMELLLTAPIEVRHIVLAKFLASLTLVLVCLLLTLYVPYTVAAFGDLDPGPVWGGYLGAFFLAATFIAVGMFLSAFTQDQIVAFLVSVCTLFALVLVGDNYLQSEFAGGFWGDFFRVLSPTPHFESIGRGVVDIRDLYYFLGLSGLFLFLNVQVINLRRWR